MRERHAVAFQPGGWCREEMGMEEADRQSPHRQAHFLAEVPVYGFSLRSGQGVERMRGLQRPAKPPLRIAADQLDRLLRGERAGGDLAQFIQIGGGEPGHAPQGVIASAAKQSRVAGGWVII